MVAITTQTSLTARIGLGMAALGRPGYINLDRSSIFGKDTPRNESFMQERADAVLSKAFDLGVTWFDCARSYGLSEKFVGEYLRKRGVAPAVGGDKGGGETAVVSSKWGYTYVADWKVSLEAGEPHEIKEHTVENFLKQIEETTTYVGEYINLYQIHSATFDSGVLTDTRVHEALAKCKSERGWNIGLSVSGPQQNDIIRTAMTVTTQDGNRLFDSVQCTYNVLEQKPHDALVEASSSGMDVIIKEGLANGRALRHPFLTDACRRWGGGDNALVTPDQLALACVLAQPFSPRVLSGAVTPEQLESNCKAVNLVDRLVGEGDLLREIMKGCVMDSEEYWSERSDLSWN